MKVAVLRTRASVHDMTSLLSISGYFEIALLCLAMVHDQSSFIQGRCEICES
jgi:hypothetical protein